MQHALDAFLSIAGQHPTAALLFIGCIAFAESLAIVGTLVPAAVVMFGGGALVGHGTLDLWWTLGVAAAGAVAGDALSYELGRRQEHRVRGWRLVRRHAQAMDKAQRLVLRHGAASVVMARFMGAVRAFVPLLAGSARMPAGKFYARIVASALLWAPAHILPGIAFGASLHLAEQASGRLAALLLLLAALVWAAAALARFTIRSVVPATRMLRARALGIAAGRPAWWARVLRLLLDPERPGSAALLAALLVLLASMWLFLGVLEDVVRHDPLVMADQAVFIYLQQLRTQPVDRLMVAITEMGSVGVMLPLVLAVAGALALQRCWRTAAYWLATAASAELVVQVLKRTLGRHRPLAMYHGAEQYSFPSGHATITVVVLAYLAFLLTRGQSMRWKLGVGATAAVYVALVGFSRLYLGAHWMSDVLGGFSFGLAAASLSAMVYTQHRAPEAIHPRRIAVVAAATLVVAASAWGWWRGPTDRQQYAQAPSPTKAHGGRLEDRRAAGDPWRPARVCRSKAGAVHAAARVHGRCIARGDGAGGVGACPGTVARLRAGGPGAAPGYRGTSRAAQVRRRAAIRHRADAAATGRKRRPPCVATVAVGLGAHGRYPDLVRSLLPRSAAPPELQLPASRGSGSGGLRCGPRQRRLAPARLRRKSIAAATLGLQRAVRVRLALGGVRALTPP